MHLQALPVTLQPSAADFANNFTATGTSTQRFTNITASVLLPNTPAASATCDVNACLHACAT
jgi:hypothetical protein